MLDPKKPLLKGLVGMLLALFIVEAEGPCGQVEGERRARLTWIGAMGDLDGLPCGRSTVAIATMRMNVTIRNSIMFVGF